MGDSQVRLADGIARLTGDVHAFDRTISEHIGEVTWEESALLLRLALEQVDLLRAAVGAIEARIITARREAGIHEDVEVPGVGIVGVHRSKNRRSWDSEGVAARVLDAHLAATGGEIPDPWTVRDWILEAAGISYWKVTTLRRLGIHPSDFCDEEPGIQRVKIIGGPS